MKKKFFFATAVLSLLLSSCIQDEDPYREADIEKMSLPADVMMTSVVNQDLKRVFLMVYDTTGFQSKKIAPTIIVSPNATIFPSSGDSVQLENYYTEYIVTSESGDLKKYIVEVVPYVPLKFGFEEWYTVSNKDKTKVYDMLSETLWSNANAGLNFVYPNHTPFPTRKTRESYSGDYAAFLETTKGKRSVIGTIMDIPLYAGSLFQGAFVTKLNDPVSSAKFGQIHPEYAGKPIRFTGWYKYEAGTNYQLFRNPQGERHGLRDVIEVPGRADELDIYAILFEVKQGNEGKEQYLTAKDLEDLENSKLKIVATAILEDRTSKSIYTKFDIPFRYQAEINYKEYDYKLAIVFSSSKEGAFYEGSPGSRLWVDDVEIECASFTK